MTESWADVVSKNILYVGPPPGFKLLPHCLCQKCNKSSYKNIVFDIEHKEKVLKILKQYKIHYKIQYFTTKFEIGIYICEELWNNTNLSNL